MLFIAALTMAVYALLNVLLGERMWIDVLRESFRERPWGVYSHAFTSLFGIVLGPVQFVNRIRQRRPALHRWLGRIYTVSCLAAGLTGLYMAAYAFGGLPAQLGFTGMALAIIVSTAIAYGKIRQRDIASHRAWMIRSYSVMFSAVTFRLWLLVFSLASGGDLWLAYGLASWLSWVLNLAFAEWFIHRNYGARAPASPAV